MTGVISGGGGLTVEDGVGGGILTLTNAADTYSGGTVLNGGTLSVARDADLGSTIGGITLNGGTLQANSSGTGIVSGRTVTLDSGNGAFDTNGLASTLSGNVTGVGELIVTDGAGGGTLTLTNNANSYQGGTELNSGTLIISADGALGAGLLTFNGGTLESGGAGTGLSSSRPIYLTGSGGTFNANGLNSTFSGVIGGVGGLALEDPTGRGVLTLTNANNTFSGGTTLNSGTLSAVSDAVLGDADGGITFDGGTLQANSAGSGLSSARSITMEGNGIFDANGLQSSLSGTISGGGALTFVDSAGGGLVAVSGSNAYSGGTVINGARVAITNSQALGGGFVEFIGGTLQAGAAGIALSNQIVLGGTGTIDADANDIVVSGNISGASALILRDSLGGNGQITLSGTNTQTGGVAIDGTVTVAASAVNALGSGAVVMTGGTGAATLNIVANQTIGSLDGDADSKITLLGSNLAVGGNGVDTVYSGSLIDDGGSALTKTGGGVLTLSGPWSVATTVVNGGTLELGANATDAGAITVNSGAAFNLNGFNQNGSGAFVNNGTVATGLGTLTAGSFSGTGTLEVNVLGSGANLHVTGGANLTDQTLQVEGHPASGEYTIVTAGSLTGEFLACDVPGGYTCRQSDALAGTLTLELIANSYTSAGQSANQGAVASALNAAVSVAGGDLAAVLNQLGNLPAAQLNQALDQIGPVSMAAMSGVRDAAAGLQSAALGQRMSGLQGGDLEPDGGPLSYFTVSGPGRSNTLLADGIGDSSPWDLTADTNSLTDSPLGFFAAAVDATGRLNSISGGAGYQPGYTFGAAGGLVGADYRFDEQTAAGVFVGYLDGAAAISGGGSVDNQSARGGAYLTVRREGLRTDVSGGAAYDLFTTSRDISSIGRTATASPKGAEFNFDVQTSYDLPAGAYVVAPFVGASYDSLTVCAYNESGAESMDLSVARQTAQSARSDLGAKVSRRFGRGSLSATPFASLGWGHEFEDQSRAIQAELAGGAGGPFSVQTADASRDAALIAAGVDVAGRGGWDVRLAYAGDLRTDFAENTFSGSVRLRFEAPEWIP